jgi:hypothetical protein
MEPNGVDLPGTARSPSEFSEFPRVSNLRKCDVPWLTMTPRACDSAKTLSSFEAVPAPDDGPHRCSYLAKCLVSVGGRPLVRVLGASAVPSKPTVTRLHSAHHVVLAAGPDRFEAAADSTVS